MQTLLTERAVASLAGVSTRTVRSRACELITTRAEEPARNGRRPRVYQLRSLAPTLQELFAAQFGGPDSEQNPEQSIVFPLLPGRYNLSASDRAEAERRYHILEPLIAPERFEVLWLQNGRVKSRLIEAIADEHQIGRRTLYEWLRNFEACGLPGLVRHDRSDKGFPKALNRAALDFILAAALPRSGFYGELSVREIYRAYGEERAWRMEHASKKLGDFELRKYSRYVDPNSGRLSPAAQLPQVCYETFRHWYSRIPEVVKVFAREGEEAFHNTQEILSFRELSAVEPMDYLVMDHRLLDIFCLVRTKNGWRLARPWLTAAIDMRTRKWLAWAVVETPSSDSIASVLRRSFVQWGVPLAVYWDNGKDFTCEWLEGKHTHARTESAVKELEPAMRGVLETLNVRVVHAIVRRARAKILEPNFGNTANFDKTLPWYCGHKPTARPERFAKLLEEHEAWLRGQPTEPVFPTIEQVAALYDEFLDSLNEREHSGEGMSKITPTGRGWMCPNECWERLIGNVERRTIPEEVLQFCFAKRRKIKVRNGELRITFGGRQHHYRPLDSSVGLMKLNGNEVEFAYDPLDLETGVVYSQNRFVGLVTNVELRKMGEQSFVEDEKNRRRARREVKRFVEAVHGQVYVPGTLERLARRTAVQPARREPVRPEVPVPLPAAIQDASKAVQKEKEFSFAAAVSGAEAGADLIRKANAAAYQDNDVEDEFQFYGEGIQL